jgi:hypothetical protein
MAQKWLRGLPLIALGLLFLAGCQIDQDAPSDPLGRVVEGAAKCKSPALNNASTIFPPSPDPRRGQVEDLCKAILDGAIDPDIGADRLHVLAYTAWQAGTLASGTTTADLVAYNAVVRGLNPVAALGADEKPIWTATNVSGGEFLAAGEISTSANPATFCFASGQWCFIINAGVPYYFTAEAIAEQPTLGLCPGPLPNDCEPGAVHIDLNPDSAIDDSLDATNITVWSCTDFATSLARFEVTPEGDVGAGEYGEEAVEPVPSGLNCLDNVFLLNGVQRWVWTGVQPLRWAFGAAPAYAAGTGVTFARASQIAGGEFGVPSARDLTARVSSRYASVAQGTLANLWEDSSLTHLISSCVTERVSQKVGECTWENVPVVDENGDGICYWGTVEKVENPSTTHTGAMEVCVDKDDPAKNATKTFTFDIR